MCFENVKSIKLKRCIYTNLGAFDSQVFLNTQKSPWNLEYSRNAKTDELFLGNLQLIFELSFTC